MAALLSNISITDNKYLPSPPTSLPVLSCLSSHPKRLLEICSKHLKPLHYAYPSLLNQQTALTEQFCNIWGYRFTKSLNAFLIIIDWASKDRCKSEVVQRPRQKGGTALSDLPGEKHPPTPTWQVGYAVWHLFYFQITVFLSGMQYKLSASN